MEFVFFVALMGFRFESCVCCLLLSCIWQKNISSARALLDYCTIRKYCTSTRLVPINKRLKLQHDFPLDPTDRGSFSSNAPGRYNNRTPGDPFQGRHPMADSLIDSPPVDPLVHAWSAQMSELTNLNAQDRSVNATFEADFEAELADRAAANAEHELQFGWKCFYDASSDDESDTSRSDQAYDIRQVDHRPDPLML